MKKIFIIAAIVLGLFRGYSQNNIFTKSTMVILVTEAQKTYVKGTNYDDWVKTQIGASIPTMQESNVLKDIYSFVLSKQSPESIFKNYNGVSLSEFGKTPNSIKAFSEVTARCGWRCLIGNIMMWIHGILGNLPDYP